MKHSYIALSRGLRILAEHIAECSGIKNPYTFNQHELYYNWIDALNNLGNAILTPASKTSIILNQRPSKFGDATFVSKEGNIYVLWDFFLQHKNLYWFNWMSRIVAASKKDLVKYGLKDVYAIFEKIFATDADIIPLSVILREPITQIEKDECQTNINNFLSYRKDPTCNDIQADSYLKSCIKQIVKTISADECIVFLAQPIKNNKNFFELLLDNIQNGINADYYSWMIQWLVNKYLNYDKQYETLLNVISKSHLSNITLVHLKQALKTIFERGNVDLVQVYNNIQKAGFTIELKKQLSNLLNLNSYECDSNVFRFIFDSDVKSFIKQFTDPINPCELQNDTSLVKSMLQGLIKHIDQKGNITNHAEIAKFIINLPIDSPQCQLPKVSDITMPDKHYNFLASIKVLYMHIAGDAPEIAIALLTQNLQGMKQTEETKAKWRISLIKLVINEPKLACAIGQYIDIPAINHKAFIEPYTFNGHKTNLFIACMENLRKADTPNVAKIYSQMLGNMFVEIASSTALSELITFKNDNNDTVCHLLIWTIYTLISRNDSNNFGPIIKDLHGILNVLIPDIKPQSLGTNNNGESVLYTNIRYYFAKNLALHTILEEQKRINAQILNSNLLALDVINTFQNSINVNNISSVKAASIRNRVENSDTEIITVKDGEYNDKQLLNFDISNLKQCISMRWQSIEICLEYASDQLVIDSFNKILSSAIVSNDDPTKIAAIINCFIKNKFKELFDIGTFKKLSYQIVNLLMRSMDWHIYLTDICKNLNDLIMQLDDITAIENAACNILEALINLDAKNKQFNTVHISDIAEKLFGILSYQNQQNILKNLALLVKGYPHISIIFDIFRYSNQNIANSDLMQQAALSWQNQQQLQQNILPIEQIKAIFISNRQIVMDKYAYVFLGDMPTNLNSLIIYSKKNTEETKDFLLQLETAWPTFIYNFYILTAKNNKLDELWKFPELRENILTHILNTFDSSSDITLRYNNELSKFLDVPNAPFKSLIKLVSPYKDFFNEQKNKLYKLESKPEFATAQLNFLQLQAEYIKILKDLVSKINNDDWADITADMYMSSPVIDLTLTRDRQEAERLIELLDDEAVIDEDEFIQLCQKLATEPNLQPMTKSKLNAFFKKWEVPMIKMLHPTEHSENHDVFLTEVVDLNSSIYLDLNCLKGVYPKAFTDSLFQKSIGMLKTKLVIKKYTSIESKLEIVEVDEQSANNIVLALRISKTYIRNNYALRDEFLLENLKTIALLLKSDFFEFFSKLSKQTLLSKVLFILTESSQKKGKYSHEFQYFGFALLALKQALAKLGNIVLYNDKYDNEYTANQAARNLVSFFRQVYYFEKFKDSQKEITASDMVKVIQIILFKIDQNSCIKLIEALFDDNGIRFWTECGKNLTLQCSQIVAFLYQSIEARGLMQYFQTKIEQCMSMHGYLKTFFAQCDQLYMNQPNIQSNIDQISGNTIKLNF